MADTDIDFDSDLSAASPKKQKKTCNYCHMTTKLLPNKPFCKRCADNSYKICIRCKLPYNSDKYFEKSLKRCNSCHEKYLKEKSRREQKKKHSKSSTVMTMMMKHKQKNVKRKSLLRTLPK